MLDKLLTLPFLILEMLEQIKRIMKSDNIWTKGVIFNSEITDPSNYQIISTS